jgi:hypothetical protein
MPKTAAPQQISDGSHPDAARNRVSFVERAESGDVLSLPLFVSLSVVAVCAFNIRWLRSSEVMTA